MKKETQLSAKVDEDMAEKVAEYAAKYDLTTAQVVRRALKVFFNECEKKCGVE